MKKSHSSAMSLELSESQEDYLEAIGRLCEENKVARVTDIARRLKVRKSSVSVALQCLAERQLIQYDPYSFITLTRQGSLYASEISRKHEALQTFFMDRLGLDRETSDRNACRMEHALDSEVMEKLLQFLGKK